MPIPNSLYINKKPSNLAIIIAFFMGIYFLYKGVGYITIPDFEVIGIAESICGIILIGLSVWLFIKKPKKEEIFIIYGLRESLTTSRIIQNHMNTLNQILITIIPLTLLMGCGIKNSNSETLNEEFSNVECVGIDLGLPSGTIWAESNLGATSCEEPGNVFYWGDVNVFEPGIRYKYVNDCYYDGGGETKYLKYVTNEKNGQIDGLTLLDPQDDAAFIIVGNGWQMPTIDDIDELFEFCTQKYDTCNNQEGITFVGTNGNSIFFPYHKRRGDIGGVPFGEPVYDPIYWSKNLVSESNPEWSYFNRSDDWLACGIEITTTYHTEEDKETIAQKGFHYRTTPGFIRPVCHK